MQQQKNSVLMVGSNTGKLKALESELNSQCDLTSTMSATQAVASLQDAVYAAIIVDGDSLDAEGLNLIEQCATRYADMVRVWLTSTIDEDAQQRLIASNHSTFWVRSAPTLSLVPILNAAVAQRQNILVLKEHLDLKSELMDLDRRLHPELDAYELAERAAKEMARLPEVEAAAVYCFNEKGEPIPPHMVKGEVEFETPDLGRANSTPVSVDDYHLYTVRIGELSTPKAAIALKLTHLESDVIRYLDFVGRHCQQTLLLSKLNQERPSILSPVPDDPLRGEDNKIAGTVSASQMSDALTTPSTVTASTADALRRIVKNIADIAEQHPHLADDITELKEISIDLRMASDVMSRLLDRLKLIQNDIVAE